MTTDTTKIPNELLVRWTDTGVLSGAHVKYLEIVTVDGVVVITKMGDAIPISAAGDFPFEKFLPAIQAGAIASAERAWAEAEAAKQQAHADVTAANERTAEAAAQQAEAEAKLKQAVLQIGGLQVLVKAQEQRTAELLADIAHMQTLIPDSEAAPR
jgi:hypothetical protein